MSTVDFLVQKDKLQNTETRETPQLPLADGQVRVRIDRFALTSNNITYAAFGDAMNYWDFFPVAQAAGAGVGAGAGNVGPAGAPSPPSVTWGRIPVWGFGDVAESNQAGVAVGERLYGYFPMSSSVVLQPTRLSAEHQPGH